MADVIRELAEATVATNQMDVVVGDRAEGLVEFHLVSMAVLPYIGQMAKPVEFLGSSKKDLRACPDGVQDVIGYALYRSQIGDKHAQTKPLKGFAGAGVLEVVEDHDGDTYRAVYTVRFANAVYVLHVFQKKSKRGIGTPKADIDLIKQRLREAAARAKVEQAKGHKP